MNLYRYKYHYCVYYEFVARKAMLVLIGMFLNDSVWTVFCLTTVVLGAALAVHVVLRPFVVTCTGTSCSGRRAPAVRSTT